MQRLAALVHRIDCSGGTAAQVTFTEGRLRCLGVYQGSDLVRSEQAGAAVHQEQVGGGQAIVAFDASPKPLELFVDSRAGNGWPPSSVVVSEIRVSGPAKTARRVLIVAREEQGLRMMIGRSSNWV